MSCFGIRPREGTAVPCYTASGITSFAYLIGSSFMSVIQYTGVQQQRAMSSTKGAWTIVLAMQKFATLYCPFCFAGVEESEWVARGRGMARGLH